jgi:hypothetical protein
LSAADWFGLIFHAIGEGVSAAIAAGREKRTALTGQAPDLGWRARQAASSSAAKKASAPR